MSGEKALPPAMGLEATGAERNLPPPPPNLPVGFVPQQVILPIEQSIPQKPEGPPNPRILPMKRPGKGRAGRSVKLLSNHFGVTFSNLKESFHYNVTISSDRGPISNKILSRKIMDKVKDVYGKTELDGKEFAYDGEKSMFTIGALPQVNTECTIFLEEASSSRAGDHQIKKMRIDGRKFKVEIKFAAKISMKSLEAVLRGDVSDRYQDALRILDIILRQHAARKNYLLVRQSFFPRSIDALVDLGGGVHGCKGYHVSFRPSQKGLSLNMDVSTTTLIKHGSIIDFLSRNQNVESPRKVDWLKARRVLKGVRIKTLHTNMEFKVLGFSENICKEQLFSLRVRNQNNEETGYPPKTVEVTVWEYFTNTKQMSLRDSADLPCVSVGKPKQPIYLPIELCEILPGQRYTKGLTTAQRSSLVEESRWEPGKRVKVLQKAMTDNDYSSDPLLRASNINVHRQLMVIDGRILDPPKLKFGQGGVREEFPQRGHWNFNNKKFDLISISQIFCENQRDMCSNPVDRVDRMLDQMKSKISTKPNFLLCLLPERKTSDLYGPWKKKFLSEMGIVNQCIVPSKKMNDQYYTNVALKINAKFGGLNSVLSLECNSSIPGISSQPTMIIGMDVSHGSPGHGDTPSIASVVSSREWPLISRYRASVRTQSRNVEMIEALYKPKPSEQDGETIDVGMISELLLDFCGTCKSSPLGRKPQQMVIFRDGVGESQFDQVLNVELRAILKACNHFENGYRPKVTLIIAQKNHHTKLFQQNASNNVEPGTVVDTHICHPRNFDFFMCPQNGRIGTSRPTHYHVLLDENNFGVDNIQILAHALSYVYQRSTTAISAVAPINYAHLAASQMQQFLKADDLLESASRSGRGESSAGSSGGNIPELPKLHKDVCTSMYFC